MPSTRGRQAFENLTTEMGLFCCLLNIYLEVAFRILGMLNIPSFQYLLIYKLMHLTRHSMWTIFTSQERSTF